MREGKLNFEHSSLSSRHDLATISSTAKAHDIRSTLSWDTLTRPRKWYISLVVLKVPSSSQFQTRLSHPRLTM
jgi:hypothetical protein